MAKLTNNKKKHLTIIGKRWFQKGPGNTYHSVKVYLDGELVYEHPFNYGYGDSFLDTAILGMRDLAILAKDGKEFGTQFLRVVFQII